MNTENSGIFFDGWFMGRFLYEEDDTKIYSVTKETTDGTLIRHLRVTQIHTDAPYEKNELYPAKIQKLISSVELMQKMCNCKNIVKFYGCRVLNNGNGSFTFLVLTDAAVPLYLKYNLEDMPLTDSLKIAVSVCDAVNDFRSIGINHRRLYPENVYVTESGVFELGDFGLSDVFIKNEDFISPEEYSVSDNTKSSDIYSIGIMLYKMLCHNRAPFMPAYPIEITEENRNNAFMRRMNGEVPSAPADSQSGINEIIKKTCAYRPSERYNSPSSLKADIESIICSIDPVYISSSVSHGNTDTEEAEQEKEEQAYTTDDSASLAYDTDNKDDDYDYIPDTKEETKKLIIGVVAAIAVIVVFTVSFICVTIFKPGKDKPEPSSSSETSQTTEESSATVPSTEEATSATTTEPPTTESTTVTTTEPITAPSTEITVPVTATLPVTTTTTEPPTTETTKPQIRYIHIDEVQTEIYSEDDNIEEILVFIPKTFGDKVTGIGNAVLYMYDSEDKVVRTDSVSLNCYYDRDYAGTTICDIVLPSGISAGTNPGEEDNDYRFLLSFPKGCIVGYEFANEAFSVNF